MNRAYRVALFCGVCPLVVGVSIFLLWLVTHWDWLMWAGIGTILGGIAMVRIGARALIASHRESKWDATVSRSRVWRSTLLCAGLLFSNFLAALSIVVTVDRILGITAHHGVLLPDKSGQIKISGWRSKKSQVLAFDGDYDQLNKEGNRKMYSVSIRITGHIDGSAVINHWGSLMGGDLPHTISGDVDWHADAESDIPYIRLTYDPQNVADGSLVFQVTFR